MISPRRRNLLICLGCWVCMLPFFWVVAGALPSYAEEAQGSETPLDLRAFLSETRGAWTIDASEISYDPERKIYEAKGNVKITSGDRVLQADYAELDSVNRRAEMRGNVYLQFKKDWLRGEHVIWNLDEETGEVDGGLAYFADNQLYTQAERIEKKGTSQYEVRNGVLTSCDPANPDWKIRYGSLKVDTEGEAWATNSSFWIWKLPVLYSPLIFVPFQKERQSGFLLPWAGFSDLNGFQAELPFYWAIREDMDATFFLRGMEKRGVMGGLEFRINNDSWGEGIWLVNYLNDMVDKNDLKEAGYTFETDNRYWIRSRHSFHLPYDTVGRLDLDLASDRNFFREFSNGSASADYTDKLFREGFGRGLVNDENSLLRESSLYLEQPHESWLISMDARYWDQLEGALEASTMQKMPSFAYSILPSGIGDLPLYYGLNSSLTSYYREEGDRGSRLDVQPRLYLPYQWKSYLDLQASAGFRATGYYVDWDPDRYDSAAGRAVTDARLSLSSRLNRVYDLHWGDMVAVQHAIRPEVVYEYVPEPLKGPQIPLFDRLDTNPARNRVEYGFSTFLTAKSMTKGQDGEEVPSYSEVARLKVFQGYNFEPTSAEVRTILLDTQRDSGPTDVGLRLDITPKRSITFSYDLDVSVDHGSPTLHDIYMTFKTARGDLFRVDYQYRAESVIDELITRLNVAIVPNFHFITYHDYSFDQQTLYTQGYGFRYDHGCWALGVAYENKDNDHRVALTVNLLGLGSFGSSKTYTGVSD